MRRRRLFIFAAASSHQHSHAALTPHPACFQCPFGDVRMGRGDARRLGLLSCLVPVPGLLRHGRLHTPQSLPVLDRPA